MARLKAPSTADFPSEEENIRWNEADLVVYVTAAVDAQNGSGARIRTRYVCQPSRSGGPWKVEQVAFTE